MNDPSQLDVWSQYETLQSRRRLVFLGASNLSRAFPNVVSISQRVFNSPLSIYIAKGHGRSYGKESSCFGKKNSGIFSCGIWRALKPEKNVPITAFITDIGNDLAYEVPVKTIIEWVSACVDRLVAMGAQVVLSDLPLEVLKQVSTTRYRVLRSAIFPQCRLGLAEMLRRAQKLSERLHELAESKEITVFVGQKSWYGFDPIHPRRRFLPEMWSQILGQVAATPRGLSRHRCPVALSWYLRGLRPESWSSFSLARRAPQPNGVLLDGTTIALY